VDAAAILPFEQDAPKLVMFCRSSIVVAADGEQVVGFAGTIGSYISWLCVHPAHRVKGVATALLRVLLDGIEGQARLNVFARNTAARPLYEQFGFVVEKEFVGNFNGHEVDVVRLRLDKG
jgi:ribosomal protein S18 acetylase RimI-like enzyme